MVWTNLTFPYGSKLSSAQMTQLQANFAAMAAGDAGAPEIDNIALNTDTGAVTGALAAQTFLDIDLQAYCFFPHIYSEENLHRVTGNTDATDDQVAYMGLYNIGGDSKNYAVRYRYVTASDEPFIYALKDKATGKIIHLWTCGDPPPGYWGLSEAPQDFKAPVRLKPCNQDDYEEIILFKQDAEFLTEINTKANADKKMPYETIDEYEFDKTKKLFKKKNIDQI